MVNVTLAHGLLALNYPRDAMLAWY